eukprot:g4364.t1
MPADVPAKDAKVSLKKSVKQETYGGPARAKSGFMLFCDEKRPEVMKQLQEEAADGKLKMADMGKKLGDMWKEVADKTKWETVAAEQKKSYEAKLEEWKKSAEYKEYLKADGAHKKKKKGAAAKKEAQESGMPKAPASGYMQFSASIMKEVMEEMQKKNVYDRTSDAAQQELDPKKALKASGQPTKPGSAYFLYSQEVTTTVIEELKAQGKPAGMKERSAVIKGETEGSLILVLVVTKYDALSAEQKEKYEAKHKELAVKYEADMKEFKKTPEFKKFNALIQKDKKRASSTKPKAAGSKKRKVEGAEGAGRGTEEPQPEESPADEEEVSEEVEVDDDEEESPEEAAEE